MEFDYLDFRPGMSWNLMLANVCAAELSTVLDCLDCRNLTH